MNGWRFKVKKTSCIQGNMVVPHFTNKQINVFLTNSLINSKVQDPLSLDTY